MDPDTLPKGGDPDFDAGAGMIEAYRQMLASLFLATLGLIVVMGGISLGVHFLLLDKPEEADPPILLAVALAGALGALFSALLRLYNVRDLPRALIDPNLQRLRNRYLLMYSMVPIMMGFIGAVIVYLAVLADIVSGALFPEMQCKSVTGDCASFIGLFSLAPADAPDYAKALVIGFVSGFSERLVRDVLGTVEKASK